MPNFNFAAFLGKPFALSLVPRFCEGFGGATAKTASSEETTGYGI